MGWRTNENEVSLRLVSFNEVENEGQAVIELFETSEFELLGEPVPHPKGGVNVLVRCDRRQIDHLISFLAESPFRPGI